MPVITLRLNRNRQPRHANPAPVVFRDSRNKVVMITNYNYFFGIEDNSVDLQIMVEVDCKIYVHTNNDQKQ